MDIDTLDPSWCAWFSGFVDGEGTFDISINSDTARHPHSVVADFRIKLRGDDIDVLREIRQTLQCGRVGLVSLRASRSNGRPGSRDQAVWYVYKIAVHTSVIIPLLRRYPLRTKKASAFDVWAAACEHLYRKEHLGSTDRIRELRDLLITTRRYPDLPAPTSPANGGH